MEPTSTTTSRTARKAAPSSTTTALWRRSPSDSGKWAARTRYVAAWMGVLGLAASLVWLSTWLRPPRTTALVLVGAEYQENLLLPHNVPGWRGLQDLAKAASDDRGLRFWGRPMLLAAGPPQELQRRTDWTSLVQKPTESGVIVYLALHGGADDQGPYLLPADADANADPASGNRLRIAQLLDVLAKLPSYRHKLLVLDAVYMSSNWRLGMLDNGFVRGLVDLESRILEIPNLVVISATDVDQLGTICEPWGRTALAQYLIQGLEGAADDHNANGRIDAWELFSYLQANVWQWAQTNANMVQTPLLLPRGSVGTERARNFDLTVADKNYIETEPPVPGTFVEPPELSTAWQTYQQLAEQQPSPATYSPYTWRTYQMTLLRIDQLTRAGAADSTSRLYRNLAELEQQLARSRTVDLTSSGLSFSMPAATGQVLPDSSANTEQDPLEDAAAQALNDLWTAGADNYAKKWAAARAAAQTAGLPLDGLRLRVAERIVSRAAEDPANNVATACALLTLIDDPLRVRSAESQLLLMLGRDLPTSTMPVELANLVQSALQVRMLAERVALSVGGGRYSHSEAVWPWIAERLQTADGLRRRGEDLLLADSSQWPQSRLYLDQANQLYTAIARDGAVVRDSISLRNLTFATLPVYTIWLAHTSGEGSAAGTHVSIDQIEQLWANVHVLADILASPDPARIGTQRGPAAAAPAAPSLAEAAEQVRQAYRTLAEQMHQRWNDLSSSDSLAASSDSSIRLAIAMHDADLRAVLTTSPRAEPATKPAGGGDAGQPPAHPDAPQPHPQPPQPKPPQAAATRARPVFSDARTASPADLEQRTIERAQRNGRLALAMLGTRWFDQVAAQGNESFAQVRHRLDVFPVESQWWVSLLNIGQEVGLRFTQIPPTIQSNLRAAQTADDTKAAALLNDADRLARIALPTQPGLTLDATVAQCRAFRLQRLLVWLTGRTIDDHWYDVDPDAEPYYLAAGAELLSDAGRLDTHTDVVNAMRTRLMQPGNLVVEAASRLSLTTEQSLEVEFRLLPGSGAYVPPGFPILWADTGSNLQLAYPPAGQRQTREIKGDDQGSLVACTIRSPLLAESERTPPAQPTVDTTSLNLTVLYRGQRIVTKTGVDLHLAPDVVACRYPTVDRASLAVQTDASLKAQLGEGTGAVAIVLDASGSMGPAAGKTYDGTTKYQEATAALAKVLPQIPRGTVVSVWVFGQAIGSQKTAAAPEQTVQRLVGPAVWDPQQPGAVSQLMSKVSYPAVQPWNQSPVVRAMLAAKDDLQSVAGPKNLVVLTDGVDNRFEFDTQLRSQAPTIQGVLRRNFDNSGITVSIVAFKVVDAEQDRVQEQFRVVESFTPPGHWFTVNETQQLAEVLHQAFGQRVRYWVEDFDNRLIQGVPAAGLDISRDAANQRWFPGHLPPGSYRVRTMSAPPISANVALERGDLLLLNLTQDARGIRLERSAWARSTFPWKPVFQAAPWTATVLQNQLTPAGGLQMLVALERDPDPAETWLQLLRPRELWLHVEPQGDQPLAATVRWNYASGYPAPAWSIDVSEWPTPAPPPMAGVGASGNGATPPAAPSAPGSAPSDSPPAAATTISAAAQPRLKIWWNPDQELVPASSLDKGHDFQGLANLTNRAVRVAGDQVVLESVSVEQHFVETSPGVRQQQSCLVVRMAHAPQRQVLTRPQGLTYGGFEHRYFAAANKYTALFWPVTSDQAEDTLQRLDLYSLPTMQRQAERRGFALSIDNLPAPQSSDVRPRPPIDLE